MLQLGIGAEELLASALCAGQGQLRMAPGVVADEMAGLVNLHHQGPLGGGVLAQQEERCVNLVPGQRFQE
jgi:hypothetical protein